MYDTPPIGQKKIRIEEDYCEIDVSCPFVLIFIDLKNVSNKREHNEEISPFRGILHFEKKKVVISKFEIQIFKINYKIKINNSISHSASDNIANNSSNWAATTRFFNLFTKSRIYDEGVETASRPTSGDNSSVIFSFFFFPSLPLFLLQRRYNRRLGNDAALPMEILSYEFSQMRIRAIYARTNGPRAAQKGS